MIIESIKEKNVINLLTYTIPYLTGVKNKRKMMTPLDDFVYLINQVLLGEEPVRSIFLFVSL